MEKKCYQEIIDEVSKKLAQKIISEEKDSNGSSNESVEELQRVLIEGLRIEEYKVGTTSEPRLTKCHRFGYKCLHVDVEGISE